MLETLCGSSSIQAGGLRSAINGDAGYSLKLKLEETEVETIRRMVKMQWLYRLQLIAPKDIHLFNERGMQHYHELSHLIDHAKAWPKYSRGCPAWRPWRPIGIIS